MLDLKYSIHWLSINQRDDINSCLENGVRFMPRNIEKIRSVSSRNEEVALFVFGVRVWCKGLAFVVRRTIMDVLLSRVQTKMFARRDRNGFHLLMTSTVRSQLCLS
jgi:hypothetical protein